MRTISSATAFTKLFNSSLSYAFATPDCDNGVSARNSMLIAASASYMCCRTCSSSNLAMSVDFVTYPIGGVGSCCSPNFAALMIYSPYGDTFDTEPRPWQ